MGVLRHRPRSTALALYLVVAFLWFALPLLLESGPHYLGHGVDPQIFIWSFAWWPHAIGHGLNPFVTTLQWAPTGVNLTWATTVPGLAVPFTPLTLLAGPVVSYDTAVVLMPALGAWTAFLLCRHLTRRFWPSLVSGYLFGFSGYELGQITGHLHMTSIAALPLVALVLVRFVDGTLSRVGFVWRLGLLLAWQLLLSTEVTFTLALALILGLPLTYLLAPSVRPRLRELVVPLAEAALIAAVLTSPFLIYLVKGRGTAAVGVSPVYLGDLLNLLVPTNQEFLGIHAGSVANRFPGNDAERDLYLGPFILLIVLLYGIRARATQAARVLFAFAGLGLLLALGQSLVIDGHSTVDLPWRLVYDRGVIENVIPSRLFLFPSLAVAVMVALWTASTRGRWLPVVLPALAVLSLAPNLHASSYTTAYRVPAFFTDSRYAACVAPGSTVLPLPIAYAGDSDLWQVDTHFRWKLAGGYLGAPPKALQSPAATAAVTGSEPIPAGKSRLLARYIAAKGVSTVVLDPRAKADFAAALDSLATPHAVGGVVVYRFGSSAPAGCPTA